MVEEEVLPEHLRCNRTDGRQWRCNRRVMEDKKLCEVHYLQGRHRQYKQKVPESLKLQRKNKKVPNGDTLLENREIRAQGPEKSAKPKKRRRVIEESEAVDGAVRKMKLKKGDLKLELIRMVLKREAEKRKGKKKKRKKRKLKENDSNSEGEFMRNLPNGLMAISSALELDNAGPSCDVKIGDDLVTVTRRCFRSKNIEPLPVCTLQVVPYKQNVENLRRGKRKKCHWCQKSFSSLIKCQSCGKHFYCMDCIKERYFDTQEEVKMACPVCLGACACKICSASQCTDIECEGLLRDKSKVDKVLHFHYLICKLLPVLKQINQEHSFELEMEAKLEGRKPSEILIKQAELDKQCSCNYCKAHIVDLYRSCPSCSYNLCLSCCRDILQGNLSGSVKALTCKCPNGRKACGSGMQVSEIKSTSTCKKNNIRTYPDSSASLLSWKVPDGSVGVMCPPPEFGGCGDSSLNLRCLFPLNWTKDLEIKAEEIVGSYDLPDILDVFSRCSLCFGMDHEANEINELQAAERKDSKDNFLYCPSVVDICDNNLEHFQKHWGRGHPVIIRNVLQNKSDLSWDPVVMFCNYLKNTCTKSQNDEELLRSADCLDWFEVDIGIRQLFSGSLRGHPHANMFQEKLKLKGWLSSHLFQQQFPEHCAEIVQALPLPEYMDPKSGLLNIARMLPQKIRKPDLGPSICISYCSNEDLLQADSVTKLSCDLCDVVNFLAYSTDVPVSIEQLNELRILMKKTQDQREPTITDFDQKLDDKVKRSSLNGESTKEVGLLQACDLSFRERKLLHDRERESYSDSEISTLSCRRAIQSLKGLQNQKFPGKKTGKFHGLVRKEKSARSCGVKWDVFRRQDVPKLIEYLTRQFKELGQPCSLRRHVVHPIFDRNFFLDATHMMRLKEEFGIEPWTFDQHVGEAVMIPAGCAYQFRNLKAGVNVVLDFVSPENVSECIHLIDEIRPLPDNDESIQDILEVKKMALYGISAAIKQIRELTCVRNQRVA